MCVCARTLVCWLTTTYFEADDSYRFSGSRRNIGLEMEDVERKLLIISSSEKKFLNSLFQGMSNTRNSDSPLKDGFPPAPSPHSSALIPYITHERWEWVQCLRDEVSMSSSNIIKQITQRYRRLLFCVLMK